MFSSSILTLLTVFAVASICSSFSMQGKSTRWASGASTLKMGNLVDNIRFVKHFNRFTFKTLYKCVAAAGLEETLAGAGPLTLFAPTDAAFAELPEGTLDALLADIPKLKSILTYHVVGGSVNGEAVKAAKTIPTVNGAAITISLEGDRAYTDDAKVLTTDIAVDNGLIHIIDMVMIPGK